MTVVVPPATIGMLGGGQLGRYALVEARLMGYRTIMLDPDPSAPAGRVVDEHLVAAYDDPEALQHLTAECDVVTTEFENPPAAALDLLAATTRVAPSPTAVRIAQDRIAEKSFLAGHGFPVGPYVALGGSDSDELATGAPAAHLVDLVDGGAIVKTARLGYDGKGQRRVRGVEQTRAAWDELGGVACVVEALLDLDTELSVLVARTGDGRTACWPVAENTHVDGVLDLSVVPGQFAPGLSARAVDLALGVADALDYVGVLAVEMFVVNGELLINELAPRPHNSGHWTLDASVTSQYEQQIRAICGAGLGATSMTTAGAAMVNLLGDLWFDDSGASREPDWSTALSQSDLKLHLYGKSEPRAGRKMGHLTVLADDSAAAARRALAVRAAL